MSKIRILHITTFQGGGAGIAARRLHKALLANGYDSKFLFLDKGATSATEYQFRKKIWLIDIALRILRKVGLPLSVEQKHEFSIRKIRRHVEIFSFAVTPYKNICEHHLIKEADIIHLHWISNFIDFKTFFSGIQKPIVWTLHDMNPFQGGLHYAGDESRNDLKNHPLNIQQYNIKKRALEQLNAQQLTIVTPSVWLMNLSKKSDLLKRFQHFCIPNGIDTDVFTYRKESNKHAIAKTNVLFVAESLYNYRKGFDIVLSLLQDPEINKNFDFTAVGSEKKNSKVFNIVYTGVIRKEEEMSKLYREADIFLLPSREDNLPNSMIESLCCGTPVVGFSLGGMIETINNGENGYLSETLSVNGLKKALLLCKSNLQSFDRSEISRNAKMRYSSDAQVESLKKVYEQSMLYTTNVLQIIH